MLGLGALQDPVAVGPAHLDRLHQAARRWAGKRVIQSLGDREQQQEAAPTSTSTTGWAWQQSHRHTQYKP
jgi:hypothetical protein